MELGCRSRYTCGDLCRTTSPYLLHPYSKTKVISTDATMDPARPTRFEKKKNMLPNVPHKQQFHVCTWSGAPRQTRHAAGPCLVTGRDRSKFPRSVCSGRKLIRRNLPWGMCKSVSPAANQ